MSYTPLTEEQINARVESDAINKGIWTSTNVLRGFFSPVDAAKFGWMGDKDTTRSTEDGDYFDKRYARLLLRSTERNPDKLAAACMTTPNCLAFTGAGHMLSRYDSARNRAGTFCSSVPSGECKMWVRKKPGTSTIMGPLDGRFVLLYQDHNHASTPRRITPGYKVQLTDARNKHYDARKMRYYWTHYSLPEGGKQYRWIYIQGGTTISWVFSGDNQVDGFPPPKLYERSAFITISEASGGQYDPYMDHQNYRIGSSIYIKVNK